MNENLQKNIKDADYVIVGIGEKFGYDWSLLEKDTRYDELIRIIDKDDSLSWAIPFLQKAGMEANRDYKLSDAYSKLAQLLEDKNYYVITTTIDDYVYSCGIDNSRIVTPCGGFRQLQCEKACNSDIINIPGALLEYVQKLYNNTISLDEIRDKYPECPSCGANLVFNQIGVDNYMEDGYLYKWAAYREWMEKTMNRNVLLIELGAGLGFMSVIRSPFEKIAGYNKKSLLYRVHPTLYMKTPQIAERCISVQADPKDWVLNI